MHDRLRSDQRSTPGSAPSAYLRAGPTRVGLFCREPECRQPAFRRDGDQASVAALLAAAADRDDHELEVHGLRYAPPPTSIERRPYNAGPAARRKKLIE